MKNLKFNFLLISILSILFISGAQAQEVFKLDNENSKLIVTGTSTVHDWEMEATNFKAETVLSPGENGPSAIKHVDFSVPVEGLKSGKRIMDNKTYDALKEEKFPEIKFALKDKGDVKLSGGKTTVPGLLSIAGKTIEVQVSVDLNVENDQQFLVKGQVPLKMSEFGIDPPTAVMGSIKTGDDVVVKFDFIFQKTSEVYSGAF